MLRPSVLALDSPILDSVFDQCILDRWVSATGQCLQLHAVLCAFDELRQHVLDVGQVKDLSGTVNSNKGLGANLRKCMQFYISTYRVVCTILLTLECNCR